MRIVVLSLGGGQGVVPHEGGWGSPGSQGPKFRYKVTVRLRNPDVSTQNLEVASLKARETLNPEHKTLAPNAHNPKPQALKPYLRCKARSFPM